MLGKRVAGFQTLPSHKLTTIAVAESANLPSASAFISPESPSLDTLTRTELTKNSSERDRPAKDCARDRQRKARAHLRDPTCMPAPPHRDWYGQRRTESAHGWALIWSPIGSRAHSRTMMGQNTVPRVPLPFPNTPAPTPDLFAEGWSSLCLPRSGSAAQTIQFPPQWPSMSFPQTFPGTGLKGVHRYRLWPVKTY